MRMHTLLLLTSLWLAGGSARAAQTASSYAYREGERVVPIYLDTESIGQIDGAAVRFVPVPTAELRAALQRGALPDSAAGQYVPVFRSAPAGGIRMASLGGVIVYLPATWSPSQVQAWVQGQGLTLKQVFDAARNGLLIDSAPGLASLELANRLLKTAGVQTAKPLWFQEKTAN
jgi:hypothetical protein